MANAAEIEAGPKGTPTQEYWDGFIGAIENCPNLDTIESYIKKLNGYIDKLKKSIADGEKEIYDATIGKFNECKQEILDELEKSQDEVKEQIEDVIEGKEDIIKKASDDLEEEITDLTANTTAMDLETVAGDAAKGSPLTGTLADLYAWAGKVNAYIDTQKATTSAMITEITNHIKRVKKKSELILKAVTWWPSTVTKLTNYMTDRIQKLTDTVDQISNITPPSFPTEGIS